MAFSNLTKISNVSIISISEKENDKWMRKLHKYAESALQYYISLFGFYPFPYLVILPGDPDCGGGYPQNDGVIVIHKKPFSRSKTEEVWKWIVAHEIGHMYWGYYVLDENPRKQSKLGWLTKGLGLYFDKQYLIANKIDFDVHEKMVKHYLQAKKQNKITSFNLSDKLIKSLDFDYNTVVDHGRAYFEINEIVRVIGNKKFLVLCKKLFKKFAWKELNYENFSEFIKVNYEID